MNLVLIGYRCAGKSTVGRALAERLTRVFVDTDMLIEEYCEKSVAAIVGKYGWEHFRGLEKEVICGLSQKKNLVIATGGGSVTDEKNVHYLKKSGRLVWLRVGSETIRDRMLQDLDKGCQRPPLTSSGSLGEIKRVMGERFQAYRRAADMVVDTDHLSIGEVVQRIIESLPETGW